MLKLMGKKIYTFYAENVCLSKPVVFLSIDKCAKIKPGEKRSYYITCRSYWTCAKGVPEPHCCAQGFRFDHLHKECVMDVNGECNDPCPPVVKKYVSSKYR